MKVCGALSYAPMSQFFSLILEKETEIQKWQVKITLLKSK